jgi:hypothetical protein
LSSATNGLTVARILTLSKPPWMWMLLYWKSRKVNRFAALFWFGHRGGRPGCGDDVVDRDVVAVVGADHQ